MTKREIELFLLNYPAMTDYLVNLRESILHGGRTFTFSRSGYTGSYSDTTAKRAVRLVEISTLEKVLSLIGQWIENELQPKCRPVLIDRWRGYTWPVIAKRRGVMIWKIISDWEAMIIGLTKYLMHFVGTACDLAGTVSASGLIRRMKA